MRPSPLRLCRRDDVGGVEERDLPIALGVVGKRVPRGFLQQPVLGVVDHVGQRPALHVGVDPRFDRGKTRCSVD